jgi:hypothetical protein
VRCRHERLVKGATGKRRDVFVENAPQIEEPAMTYEFERSQTLRVVDVVEHPELVVRSEPGGPPVSSAILRLGGGHASESRGTSRRYTCGAALTL